MINIIDLPERELWASLAARPSFESGMLQGSVAEILRSVEQGGDKALLSFTQNIDGVSLDSVLVSEQELLGVEDNLDDELIDAINVARENIAKFHSAQIREAVEVETMSGVLCRQRSLPIKRVGLYIPGGSAPLFSTLLMLAVPARIAGCSEIVIATPPRKDGTVAPAILYIAKLLGINEIVKVGGAQAIAALAFGTESVKRVSKIFGPGNQFVSEAKIQVSKRVAIDMLAGPSEVMVIADESANPAFVASDLLAQAEHGADSQVFLLTTSARLAKECAAETEKQLALLSRSSIASKALENSRIIITKTLDEAIDFANYYAPEHLIINTVESWTDAYKVESAGSIFVGNYSSESAGDYASGTNHTLPTSGWAVSSGGVSLDSFLHKITYQEITEEGLLNISKTIETMALAEGLGGHRNSVRLRREYINRGRS